MTENELRAKSTQLLNWFKANNIATDEVVPICAVTAGSIIRIQALTAPANKFPAHLDAGIEIACAMVTVAAKMASTQ